ncbi:peptide-methionine (S)-S-oxide reductase [Colwellia sp. 6M3]|uniref:peptide-methionine (S)-S-oxide reductase n=1 Tax=Colwellia sp. 6M3 TaxID=2759849 RepID=UPI002873D768|nr:peptide-methionine (S)-S-oxide reductase [Colwellia sp. 6M3]
MAISKVGLGGGCHWCTEGVFASLNGIVKINQGWISSSGSNSQFSEAIEVYFEPDVISLANLVSIHLHTHACTADHSMRHKYRSAIYTYSAEQASKVDIVLRQLQTDFNEKIITQVLTFCAFKANKIELTDYLYSSPNRPFCQRYIHPKLTLLLQRFTQHVNHEKLNDSAINFSKK